MRINLIFKNLILLISITTLLQGSCFVNSRSKNKDFKEKYGVQLVLAR
ncbi:MAG: hypothetical protein ACI8WT_003004 [Clostridium sp.]|jgi:hypothetical protein